MLLTFEKDSFEEFNSLTLEDRVKAIEMIIGKGFCGAYVAKAFGVSTQVMSRVINSYLPKHNRDGMNLILTMDSKINHEK